jgi:DNA-binding transcriptional LysR family regulator
VRFVTPVVTDFLARYPEASVDLRTGAMMIDLVQEAFDLGISPFPPPDATLIRRRLGTLSLMVCGAPAYLEKHPAPHSPADPAAHNCLRYPHVQSPDEWYFADARGNLVVARLIASGALVPLLPDYRAQEVEINALYPHRRHLSAKVRAFIDMLADRFAEQQRWLRPATG